VPSRYLLIDRKFCNDTFIIVPAAGKIRLMEELKKNCFPLRNNDREILVAN